METPLQHPNDHSGANRVKVETEWTEALTSRLKIGRARLSDSGNYSCVPTSAEGASVNVNVINGNFLKITVIIYHQNSTRNHEALI